MLLCCVDPVDLNKTICVQFAGPDAAAVARDTSLQVDLDRLRAAMWWFATNNWQWLEATRGQAVLGVASLGDRLEDVLAAYARSLGGARRGVPRELLEAATRISEESVPTHLPGPADATAGAAAEAETDATAAADSSAAVLDTGREDVSFLRLWNEAIRKYHVLQELEDTYERASREHDDAARAQAQRDEALALAEAVHALRCLGATEARKRLEAYQAFLDGVSTETLRLGYCDKLLNSFAPEWWVSAFTDLFFRGGILWSSEACPCGRG